MRKQFQSLLLLPTILLIVGLACQLSGGPTPPRAVNISQEQAFKVLTPENTIKIQPTTGIVTIQITEAQASSYVAYELRDRFEPLLKNPVILFQTNRVELYGTFQSDSISANGMVSAAVKIDEQGNPKVNITDASFGPIPVPSELLANLSTTIDKTIKDATQKYEKDYKIESITISPGLATILLRHK
jgi:hypothetical protein